MKKLLTIFGLLLLLLSAAHAVVSKFGRTVIFPATQAADVAEEDPCKPGQGKQYSDVANCLPFSSSRILSKLNPGALEKSWPELFATTDPEKAGQNLYATIYAMTAVAPETQAAKNLSGKYAVTEAEMTQMLYGNISPILQRKPLITQDEAIQKTAEIQQQFQEEKDILALKADIESSVAPSEIFINGDLSDSGFDLVDDLSLIEKILFNKAVPPEVGGNFELGGNSGGAQNALNGAQPVAATGAQNGVSNNSAQNQSSETTGQAASAQQSAGANNSLLKKTLGQGTNNLGSPGSAGTIVGSPRDNPNICFDQNNLGQALQQFTQAQNVLKGNGNGPSSSGVGASGATGTSTENTGNAVSALSGGSGSQDPLPDLSAQSTSPQVKSAPAGQWLKGGDCKEPFCLSVNFVKKPVELYQNSDNCILCHLEKINAKLKETVDHNLIPGKATGNLLEPQICKKSAKSALGAIGLNFYAMSKPVQTPANDDLIYGASIDEEWKSFLSNYKPFPIYEKDPPPAEDGQGVATPPSETDRAYKAAVATAGPDTKLDQIQSMVESQLNTDRVTRESQITVVEEALQSDVDVGFYQDIRREVEQMNYYFDSFKDILHSLHEKVNGISGEQACDTLKNKKQCE